MEKAVQITLTVAAGPHLGQVFTFTGHDRFLVGRSRKAHFRLRPAEGKDLHVSRLHFLVEVNPPLCRLYDIGSRNGTFINGTRLTSGDLHDGDEIRAGHTVLRVSLQEKASGTRSSPDIFDRPTVVPGAGQATVSALVPATAVSPTSMPAAVPVAAVCMLCQSQPPAPPGPICPDCWRMAEEQPQPLPGYLLLREVGRGGVGVVYLAVRRSDQATLAVKTILPAGEPRPGVIERFLREADILRSLDHPHIVRFREMGHAGEHLYFAMDYVPGADADVLLMREGPLTVRRAVRMTNQLLVALEYAHAKGLVHRDIKPANLLLEETPSGHKIVKVADFGLARAYQASQLSGLTLQNELGGSVGYLPPEQITNFREVKPAADQYSAAATLYRLLTGHHVYDLLPNAAEQLQMILTQPPVPILARRPDLPERLAAILHRALEREPGDRFPDVGAFRRELVPFGA
jgi:serine/threonine-protein kinase